MCFVDELDDVVSAESASPSTMMRSRKSTRCGDVYVATRSPLRARAAPRSSRRCFPSRSCRRRGTTDSARCGSPSCASSARVRSRPNLNAARRAREQVVERVAVARVRTRRSTPSRPGLPLMWRSSWLTVRLRFAAMTTRSRASRGRAGTRPSGILRADPGRASA